MDDPAPDTAERSCPDSDELCEELSMRDLYVADAETSSGRSQPQRQQQEKHKQKHDNGSDNAGDDAKDNGHYEDDDDDDAASDA